MSDKRIRESELAKAIRRDGDFAYHIGRAIYAASRMRVP